MFSMTDFPCKSRIRRCAVSNTRPSFLQDILSGCKDVLSLSSRSGVVLERLGSSPLQKSCFLSCSPRGSCAGLSGENSTSASSSGSICELLGRPSASAESEQASLSS